MYRRNDYILDLIEQISMVIADIIGLKKSKKFEEVQKLVDVNLKKFLGLNENTIHKLSYKDLMNIISVNSEYDVSKCIILAELLDQEGDVYGAQGESAKSYDMYIKSMNIFIELLLLEKGKLLQQYISRVDEIEEKVRKYEIPYESKSLLFKFYETVGRFGKAEDMLFDMLDWGVLKKDTYEAGISFYENLAKKTDTELIKGDFSLHEVEEGMHKLKQHFTKQ